MNYATDAIWWRVHDTHVRALVSLLSAPPLWHSGCELPVRTLLGDSGLRTLIALDAQSAPLHDFLAAQTPTARLGIYAEYLLAFWLNHAPHAQLLGRNLHFGDKGEADLIARLNNETYHIELTCKYFIAHGHNEAQMSGFNPQDTLMRKRDTLARQCALSRTAEFTAWARAQGLDHIRSASVVRGMAFLPPQFTFETLNPYGWHGSIGLPDIENDHCRYTVLRPQEYPAPACKPESECAARADFTAPPQTLVAQLQQRADGKWHEIGRMAV